MGRMALGSSLLATFCAAALACGALGTPYGAAGDGDAGGGNGGGDAGGGASAYARRVLQDQPIAYWRLGDAVTPTARDEADKAPGAFYGTVSAAQIKAHYVGAGR